MAQQAKVHAYSQKKKKTMSSISKTQMMEKERTDSHKLSSDLQKHAVSQCTHASTQKDK